MHRNFGIAKGSTISTIRSRKRVGRGRLRQVNGDGGEMLSGGGGSGGGGGGGVYLGAGCRPCSRPAVCCWHRLPAGRQSPASPPSPGCPAIGPAAATHHHDDVITP